MEMSEQVGEVTTIVLHDAAEPLLIGPVPKLAQVPGITAVDWLGTYI